MYEDDKNGMTSEYDHFQTMALLQEVAAEVLFNLNSDQGFTGFTSDFDIMHLR